MWGFPNCLGSLDGKHIKITPPRGKGAKYWCYKGFNSIILLALVDAHSKFLFVDVGANGRVGDAALYSQSRLKQCLTNRSSLNIPSSAILPGTTHEAPYVVIADDAFPLSVHLLKPFALKNITREEEIFNGCLSRARVRVECAFGILANRFRIFLNTINLEPNKVRLITLTACTLHNFLIDKLGNKYTAQTPDSDTIRGLFLQTDRGGGMHGKNVRNVFKEYFCKVRGT